MKINSKSRLGAYKTNHVSKAPRGDEFKRLQELTNDFQEERKLFKLTSSKNGFNFYYHKSSYYDLPYFFCAFEGTTCIGYIGLVDMTKCPRPDFVLIAKAKRGAGVGFLMYDAAISYFGKLASDYSLSAGATQLWKKLSQHHKVVLMVKGKPVKIQGWEDSTKSMWSPSGGTYAYPLVKTKEGTIVSLYDLYERAKPTLYGEEINAIRSCYFRAQK